MAETDPQDCQFLVKDEYKILDRLLTDYNDGRKKTLFCLVVNLMELRALRVVMERVDSEFIELPLKERSAAVAHLLKDSSDVELKLRKKLKD